MLRLSSLYISRAQLDKNGNVGLELKRVRLSYQARLSFFRVQARLELELE